MDPKPSITDLQQSKNLGEDLAPVDRSKPSTGISPLIWLYLCRFNLQTLVNDENLSEEGLEPVNRSKPNTGMSLLIWLFLCQSSTNKH